MKILLTTSDYLPQIGGLTSFTLNIQRSLEQIDCEYKLIHWKNQDELKNLNTIAKEYDYIINVHYLPVLFLDKSFLPKCFNFIHGSELTFYSPKLMFRFYKKIFKSKILKTIEGCGGNFFISQFTQDFLVSKGFCLDESRDFIVHNSVNLEHADFCEVDLCSSINLVIAARDVPHKNLSWAPILAEKLSSMFDREVNLYTTSVTANSSDRVNVISIQGVCDSELSEIFSKSHFNMLLSTDHSNKGYFEGFGLTVLEAARFGTPSIGINQAGLTSSIHDEKNGFLIDGPEDIERIVDILSDPKRYLKMRRDSFDHLHQSHGLDQYVRLFSLFMSQKCQAS